MSTNEASESTANNMNQTDIPMNPRKRGLGWARGRGSKKPRGGISLPPKERLPREDNDTLRLTEKDIGITEYVSTHVRFNGVIKQRYSDFLVNELAMDGSEVHLTTLDPPVVTVEAVVDDSANKILSQEICDKIALLFEDPNAPTVEIPVTDKDKDERRFIHAAIKKSYGSDVVSTTVEKGTEKFISVSKYTKESPKRRSPWPGKKAEYVHFSLYKENMDTQEAISLLSYKLHLKSNCLTFAGTKDRRAKTCQRVCVKKVEPKKIASAARTLRNLSIGDFEYCFSPLKLGQLSGNRFQIVLRNVSGTDEEINSTVESLARYGFLNYYGLQRFGTQSVPTYHIGRALIKGNWQEAIELILKPRGPGESPNLQEVRSLWWKTRDAGQAYKVLRGREKCVEGLLLQGLIKSHKSDLIGALEYIPRNMRLMYLHSYQSYIWNQVLSRRIRDFGLAPIEGDMVLAEDMPILDSSLCAEDVEPVDSESAEVATVETKQPAVKILKASELSQYSITDILLPLPGHEIIYPGHEAAQWYEELMAKDGLTTSAFKHNIRKYTLCGTYRKMVVVPSKVSWRVLQYNDATKPLIQSDLDVLQKKALPEPETDGQYKALVLDFCLPSSAYATMALRELLKCDTSARHQTTLNSYSTLNVEMPTECLPTPPAAPEKTNSAVIDPEPDQ